MVFYRCTVYLHWAQSKQSTRCPKNNSSYIFLYLLLPALWSELNEVMDVLEPHYEYVSKLNAFRPKFQTILSVLKPLLQSEWKWLPYRTRLLLHSSVTQKVNMDTCVMATCVQFCTRLLPQGWAHWYANTQQVCAVSHLISLPLRSPLRSNVLHLLTAPHTYLKTEGAFQGSTLCVPN